MLLSNLESEKVRAAQPSCERYTANSPTVTGMNNKRLLLIDNLKLKVGCNRMKKDFFWTFTTAFFENKLCRMGFHCKNKRMNTGMSSHVLRTVGTYM
jgi:hypothetical protein